MRRIFLHLFNLVFMLFLAESVGYAQCPGEEKLDDDYVAFKKIYGDVINVTQYNMNPEDWWWHNSGDNQFFKVEAYDPSMPTDEKNYIVLYFWAQISAGQFKTYTDFKGPKPNQYNITTPVATYSHTEYVGWYTHDYYYWKADYSQINKSVTNYSYDANWGQCAVSSFQGNRSSTGKITPNYDISYISSIVVEEGEGGTMYIKLIRKDPKTGEEKLYITIGEPKKPDDIYKIITSINGNGTVGITPDCEYHNIGEAVTLTPAPANKDVCFKQWTGTDASLVTDKGNGTYSLTMPAHEVSLTANFGPCIIEATENVTLCGTELPYTWHGTTYSAPGSYTNDYTCPSLVEALTDSITHLVLTVHPAYNTTDGATVCDSELPYTWQSETFTAAGSKTKTLKTIHNCDSVVTFTLTVNPTYDTTDGATICDSELPYTWQSETFTAAGTKTKTLKTIHGCDSVVTFTLTVNPTYSTTDEDIVCDSELPYTWQGETFTAAGTKTKTLKTINGCDSTVTFTLTVNDTYNLNDGATICDTELPYTWEGETFTAADSKTKTLKTIHGCDSVVTFTLTVNPTYNTTDGTTVCESELPFTWENETFRKADFNNSDSKTVTRTLKSLAGCDSTVTFTLTVNKTIHKSVARTVCDKALPYKWDGLTFGGEGMQTRKLKSLVTGCDSVVDYHLSVSTGYMAIDGATVCTGDLPYTWEGYTFTKAGTKTQILRSVSTGCDSVVTFTLEVRQSPETTVKDIFCEGGTYTFGDTLITTAGTYIKRFAREGKCDSIVTLVLTALSAPVTVNEEATVTEGESYTWPGHGSRFAGLTADSTYRDTIRHTIGGCDSIYYALRLHVASPNLRMTVAADTACAGDPAFTLRLLALEGKPVACDILFDDAAHKQKFADTLSLALTAGGAENTVAVDMPLNTADTTDYVRPGTYNFTVRVSAKGGKTAEYPCSLTVLYPSWVLFQRWNDVLAVSNEDYNGHYTFSDIRWYHAGKQLEGNGDNGAYIYQELVYGDPYWAELTRTDDGKTIRTCTFYPQKLADATNAQALHVRLLPRRDSRQVGIETDAEGQYAVYDMAGRTIRTGEFGNGMQDIVFRASDANGAYLIFFRANDGRTAARKWIVR